jgi:hypothetical protein
MDLPELSNLNVKGVFHDATRLPPSVGRKIEELQSKKQLTTAESQQLRRLLREQTLAALKK